MTDNAEDYFTRFLKHEADARDAERYRWLKTRMTYCNTHPDARPVLYDISARLWYHATDDLHSETLDAVINAALAASKEKR